MGYTYYRLSALIPRDVTLTFPEVANALQGKFSRVQPAPQITVDDKSCVLRWNDWSFRLHFENQPHVIEDSREIAERFASNRADQERIAACDRRITTAADPDPDMSHFNHYIYVMETLESIKGIYVFDPNDGKFTNE